MFHSEVIMYFRIYLFIYLSLSVMYCLMQANVTLQLLATEEEVQFMDRLMEPPRAHPTTSSPPPNVVDDWMEGIEGDEIGIPTRAFNKDKLMVEKVEKIEKDVVEKLEKIENGVLEEAKMKKKLHKKCKCIELQIKSLDSRIEGIETDLKAIKKYLHRLSKVGRENFTQKCCFPLPFSLKIL